MWAEIALQALLKPQLAIIGLKCNLSDKTASIFPHTVLARQLFYIIVLGHKSENINDSIKLSQF